MAITSITLLAMRHIERQSKQLERMGVHRNAVLIKSYIGIWTALCIITLAFTFVYTLTLIEYGSLKLTDQDDERFYKLTIAM